ncbi:MAG: serine hydrolase domain-containing protein, partial [Pseudomonadota bacterium]|nr:serine hydrolase domain-containing protein [Pseudomonadota bacterium]
MSREPGVLRSALRWGSVGLFIVGLSVGPLAAKDQPTAAPQELGLLPSQLENLDARMRHYVDTGQVAGVVTLIARHGKIAHFDAYGWADRETRQPMKHDTVVRMYSMTKPLTSVALLMLYEEGKFQLDEPLEKYIPEFANVKVFEGRDSKGEPILVPPKRKPTIHDVFRHTAGFPGGGWEDEELDKAWRDGAYGGDSEAEYSRSLTEFPLAYHPGEKWIYSGAHYVQAHLVEHFSGKPFAEFVKERIFLPLDMKDSYFGQPAERPSNYATEYLLANDGTITPNPWNSEPRYGSGILGGSGLSSNARDYLQFAQMLLNGGELDGERLLSPSTVEFMTMNHLPGPMQVGRFKGRGYGLGVEVITDPAQHGVPTSVGQYGWSGAATTYFSVDPKEEMV